MTRANLQCSGISATYYNARNAALEANAEAIVDDPKIIAETTQQTIKTRSL